HAAVRAGARAWRRAGRRRADAHDGRARPGWRRALAVDQHELPAAAGPERGPRRRARIMSTMTERQLSLARLTATPVLLHEMARDATNIRACTPPKPDAC